MSVKKVDAVLDSPVSNKSKAEVVSIAGKDRILTDCPNEIPLVYFSEINELRLTQWFDSCESIEDARLKALRKGPFDGVIVVVITSENNLLFMPAR